MTTVEKLRKYAPSPLAYDEHSYKEVIDDTLTALAPHVILREDLLSKTEIKKILKENIHCEYHHREQIEDVAQAIIKAQEEKEG